MWEEKHQPLININIDKIPKPNTVVARKTTPAIKLILNSAFRLLLFLESTKDIKTKPYKYTKKNEQINRDKNKWKKTTAHWSAVLIQTIRFDCLLLQWNVWFLEWCTNHSLLSELYLTMISELESPFYTKFGSNMLKKKWKC